MPGTWPTFFLPDHVPLSQHCRPTGSAGFQSSPSQPGTLRHAAWQSAILTAEFTRPLSTFVSSCIDQLLEQSAPDNVSDMQFTIRFIYFMIYYFRNSQLRTMYRLVQLKSNTIEWQYHNSKISRQCSDRYLQCKQGTVLASIKIYQDKQFIQELWRVVQKEYKLERFTGDLEVAIEFNVTLVISTPWVKKTRHQTLAHNFTKY